MSRLGVWVLAALALLQPIIYHVQFSGLFWFGDEFGLIDEFDRVGFARWVWLTFGENFFPLFKILWGGMLFAGAGNYALVLAAIWATHALNVGLFATLLSRSGFSSVATAFAAVIFGLSASQIETLTWAVLWSSELATTFLLVGMLDCLPLAESCEPCRWRSARLVLWSTASAWSFARGLLSGPAIASFVLVRQISNSESGRSRWMTAALCLLPSIVTGIIILRLSPEDHHLAASGIARWEKVLGFGALYWALNPFLTMWLIPKGIWWAGSIYGLAGVACIPKLLLVGLGLNFARHEQRRLLIAMLLLDLGYAALLGLGRSEGDLHNTMSSRYQYNSLLCALPFLAVCFESLLQRGIVRHSIKLGVGVGIIVVVASVACLQWKPMLPSWVEWRGLGSRRLLFETNPIPAGNDLVGEPYVKNLRAKELADKYHLH